jgi:DNA (cytosine-5)-methyltransferase 1
VKAGSNAPRALDLFCGAGGLSLGLVQAGVEVVAGVDAWDVAIETYRRNFEHPGILADIAQTTPRDLRRRSNASLDDLTLVAGGPPCQGFSIQRIGPDHDARNRLILEFGRLATSLAPEYIVMENVLGLTGGRGLAVLNQLCDDLLLAGYLTNVVVVNALDYGVPQNRRRVLVIGRRPGSVELNLAPPTRLPETTVWDAIGDLPAPAIPGTVEADDPLHVESRLSGLNRCRLEHIPPGGGFEDLPVELRANCHKGGAEKIGHRGVYGRLDADRPAGTITARFDSFTRGRFAHPFEHRNLTLREGARLQSFPDTFRFNGNREEITALIGNAVPPLLARRVGNALMLAVGLRPRRVTATR